MGSETRAPQCGEHSPLAPLGGKTSAFPQTLRIETVASASPLARAGAILLRFPRLKVMP